MKQVVSLLSLTLLLTGCGPVVTFDEPQPADEENLVAFPPEVRGVYYAAPDSTWLFIDSVQVSRRRDMAFTVLRQQLDTMPEWELGDERLTNRETGETIPVRVSGDTVSGVYSMRDTLFRLSGQQLLRRWRRHLLLNTARGPGNWRVQHLTHDRQGIRLGELVTSKDLDRVGQMSAIDTLRDDSSRVEGYRLDPSRRELRRLLRIDTLGNPVFYRRAGPPPAF